MLFRSGDSRELEGVVQNTGCVAASDGSGAGRALKVTGTVNAQDTTIPTDASAVALNVTVVGPSIPGFVTVWPAGVGQPTASSLNYVGGQVVPNNVIVKVGALGVVNLAQPDQSPMVLKVAGGHNCWLSSAQSCARVPFTFTRGESALMR